MTARMRIGPATAVPPAPPALAMPDQRFDAPYRDAAAPGAQNPPGTAALRLLVLGLPVLPAVALGAMTQAWLAHGGTPVWAGLGVGIMAAFALYWIALPVVTALLGALAPPARAAASAQAAPLRVAILLPMYGEGAIATIMPAVRLLRQLAAAPGGHGYCLRVLSDTRDPDRAAVERRVVEAAVRANPTLDASWRRRAVNRDFKSGNLRDWIVTEGHLHDAMLVLDADSRMGAATVRQLADALAADASCALIQTVAQVAPGDSVWQRLQSFGSAVYGSVLGRGLARWAGVDGNYLGHNAIIRVAAFARCAGLPHLPGRAPRGGVILSHDFVEAALLRRAGWGVRMLADAGESLEAAPATLAAHIRRDRRWCQGNMQHLRLLARPGFHPVSRLHFAQGAMAYLASVLWLALLLAAMALPVAPGAAAAAPAVPPLALAVGVALLLVAPKLVGVVSHLCRGGVARGGRVAFAATLGAEVVLSVALAPVLMVQQARAVLATLAGRDIGWAPHAAGRPGWRALLRLHAAETALGVALLALIGGGVVTPWLAQVGLSLVLAAPLSWLVQREAPRWLCGGGQPSA
jgi:membrane glycosyltransferase